MFLKMWITRLVFLVILVVLMGVVVWAVFFRPPQQVTKEVTKVVEVTRVVEKTVVVQATPVPATPTPTKVVTPTPDRVDKLSTVVAQLSAQLAGGSVQAQAVQPITATMPVTVSASSLVTTTGQVTGTVPITATMVVSQGAWTISYFLGATQEMGNWKFQNPDPKIWKVFPNVDNDVYKATDGVEYGMAESIYCQQGLKCDVIVAARHYRLITGDYDTVFGKCAYGNNGAGCALLIVNVGDQTVVWRDQMVDAGFTVTGRYWNGGKLDQAIWAVGSHAAYNMLNLSSDKTNAGANCSSPAGCPKVKVTFVVVSGKEILMKGETLISR